MGDVGDELPKLVAICLEHAEGLRQSIRHHVELSGQLVDLNDVRARRSLVELSLRQPAGGPSEARQRSRQATRDEEADHQGHH